MILVRMNHRELTTESNRTRLSIMRFYDRQRERINVVGISPYLIAFLQKYLVILAESYTEDDRGDIFKTMNPLLSLTPLPADIEHAADRLATAKMNPSPRPHILYAQLTHGEPRLVNTCRLRSRAQDIGLYGYVFGGRDTHGLLKKAIIVSIAVRGVGSFTAYYGAESIR
jgi:hypothetical protein